MRIGLHVSIAGKIYESLERANALGCNTMQIFSRNPRGWQFTEFAPSDTAQFRKLKEKLEIRPVVVHIPYLINLATPDDELHRRSINAYIDDLRRTDELDAECFVTHLGSHVGSGEEGGIKRFARALNEVIDKARPKTMILLENTAGSGSMIGYRFEHIKRIMDNLDNAENIGVCLDTAHTFEAGYDIRTRAGLDSTLKTFDSLIGLKRIKVVHFNDSLSLLGSHVDRHQHIGKGNIGLSGLKRIINHPKLKDAAFIMETPKNTEKDDQMNMRLAQKMLKDK
ncbi:MAG: deoxyribonuclease IV [Candidatus Omnitrophica bacterium]|nr:deoxyribonuclease IV [Candidatus Omnitrophota bacterium]MBU0881731.1 deoxyribonuclease IV [Candidatus Omnitrophota bacterium]MBU0895257.1 deoxyribonuclease IV [Candidatus Omnitrophota bacterium]MBU1037977.1 deoxyribonuclease IV [Candidatus Omnitrophota bacterium]MBU1808799.1 deoxyribonuclease IV [Candidatus Omnitrophota bacterium]